MVYVSPVLTTSHGRTRTDENGPRSFQLVHRAPRPHPVCVWRGVHGVVRHRAGGGVRDRVDLVANERGGACDALLWG